MSLEGYKPLDLSQFTINPATFQLQSPINTHDIARQILANTSWDLAPVESLGANGKAMPHKKTFVSRLMDALSVGNYIVSDTLLAGLKAHQSDNNDSVLKDIGKTILGSTKGIDQGLLASLKGTFGNDATANDPTGKNHFGDVYLQATAKGREALDPNSNMSVDERKSILKEAYLSGLPADIIADPMNLVGAGEIKAIGKLFKGGKAGEEAATKTQQVMKLADVANESPIKKPTDLSVSPEGLNATPHAPVEPNNFDPETFDFVAASSHLPNEVDNLSNLRPKSPVGVNAPSVELPASASRLAKPKGRKSIAGVMLQHLVQGGDFKGLRERLQTSFPGLHLPKTNNYLTHLESNPKALQGLRNVPKNRIAFVEAIDRLLHADYSNAGRSLQHLRLPDLNTATAGSIKLPEMLSRAIDESAPVATGTNAAIKGRDAENLAHVINAYKGQIETGMFAGARNPEHLRQALDSGKTVKWSGPKQVNMWNTILSRTPYAGVPKYKSALKVLKAAEQHFIDAGHKPFSAAKASEAIPLRLSEVIEKIGLENFAKHPDHATTLLRSALAGGEMSSKAKEAAAEVPELKVAIDSAVQEARASGAIDEANAVKQGVDAGSTQATVASNAGNSEARTAQDVNLAAKTASDIAKLAGASRGGGDIAKEIVKSTFLKSDPVENAIARSVVNSRAALSSGKLGKFNSAHAVSTAITHVTGLPTPVVLGGRIGPAANTVERLGAWFNAAYKNEDMRPIYLKQASTARASVARRAEVWNKAVRQFGKDPELWKRAMHAAQGVYIPAANTAEHQLSVLIRQNMENLFGGSGLRTGAELENTVAGRAQLLINELNNNLPRYGLGKLKFVRGKVEDPAGVIRDYSQGTDWLKSWEAWKIEQPLNFMMRITNAVENTVREASMLNEIAARWGSATRKAGQNVAIPNPRLIGSYFTRETAEQIKVFLHHLEDIKAPNSKFLRLVDNVLSKWKSSVTIYMPSHHIRNLIGDSYMNWLAGVNDPRVYNISRKVMASQRGRYADIENVNKLTSPQALMEATQRAARGELASEKGTNVAFTMKNGKQITNDMLYTALFQKGALPGARVLEDIADDGLAISKFRPLGGRGQAAFQHLAEYREHFIRLAHGIDVIKKSSKGFEAAVEDAAAAIRKWHPDGMDLTKFERTVMRRVFPFYSWTRKALPLMIESLVMAPGKVVAYPKLMGGLSEGLTGGQGTSDPFPVDQLFPGWIRDKGIGPVLGTSGDYTIINPSNPTLDLASEFADPVRGIGSMLNPLLRIPAEELTKTDMSTGAPITNQADYLTKQIPGISTVGRVTNIGIGGPTAKFDKQGGPNYNALINLLTALGILDTGPYQKQAQYELRDYLKNGG